MTTPVGPLEPELRELIWKKLEWYFGGDRQHLRVASKDIAQIFLTREQAARRDACDKQISRIYTLANEYAWADKTMQGSETLKAHHWFNAINTVQDEITSNISTTSKESLRHVDNLAALEKLLEEAGGIIIDVTPHVPKHPAFKFTEADPEITKIVQDNLDDLF